MYMNELLFVPLQLVFPNFHVYMLHGVWNNRPIVRLRQDQTVAHGHGFGKAMYLYYE
jgi:hypothetical protein